MIRSTPPDRSKAPEIHQPTDIRLPKLHDLTLDNGIRVSVLNQPDMEIHRMTVFTEGGLAEAGNPAIALLDSQLLLEGTMATDGQSLANLLDFNGAWTNSRCGNHHRSFAIYNLPSRRSKLLPTIIEILTHPAFPADRLAKWRERLIASTAIEQKTVGYQASLLSNRLTIGSGHPLSQPADPGHIAAVERDDILNFHKKNLHPRHMRIFITGSVSTQLEEEVNRYFGSIPVPDGEEPSAMIQPFDINTGARGFKAVDGALQSAVCATLGGVGRTHPDYAALRLTVNSLGGYFGSRLSTNIRERLGLTYGINASLLGYAEGSLIRISTECDNASRDLVVEEIGAEMRRLASDPPGSDEMERICMTEYSSLLDIMETPFTVSDFYQSLHVNGVTADYFYQRLEAARTMTSERIAEIAGKYLRPELMTVAVAGPENQ